jgi:hypothetical protein
MERGEGEAVGRSMGARERRQRRRFRLCDASRGGQQPRIDGTNNKVLWVAKGSNTNFVVEGIPPGGTQPVVTVNGGPSIVDVPSAGCWKFQLTWGAAHAASTINLDVLPAGSLPQAPAA